MLENIDDNELNSLLGEFEETSQKIITDGEEEEVEIIGKKDAPKAKEDSNEIDTVSSLEELGIEDSEENEEGKEDNKESEDSFSYKAFLSHLSEQGLVQFEDKEDLEDTPDVVYESISKTIQSGIQGYKESIPSEGKQYLEYLEKGGDSSKYFETLQKPFDISSMDLDSESDQERVVREYLKLQDYSGAEIDETIEDYKTGLLLDKQAKVASKKLEKSFEKRTEALLQEQEALQEAQREQYNQYINTVNTTIESVDNIAGLEVTKAEKDSFRKYLLIRDKDGLTAYEKELQADPVKTSLELAYLKFKKYDFASAKKQGETEASKKLNWRLKNSEQTVKGGKSSQEVKQESDLSAFRQFMNKK